jgi:hypothetical protein
MLNLTVENATALGNSLDDEQTYGVGKAGDVNIGSYGMFVKVDSVTADGEGVDNILAIIMIQVLSGPRIPAVSPQALSRLFCCGLRF